MAHESFGRSIPPADRERERIAARRDERLGRRQYGGEPEPIEPSTLPVFLSFRQAIGWIAFGRITALDGDLPEVARFFSTWSVRTFPSAPELARRHSLAMAIRHVVARARWWQREKKRTRKLGQLSPIDSPPPCARPLGTSAARRRSAVGARFIVGGRERRPGRGNLA